ncbi:MAG: hypothetical protein K2L72_04225, partial [Clostridia bacterium]|nr:hypothetical protein [Clostridia bacterium]
MEKSNKATSLERVKSVAEWLLRTRVNKTPYSPIIVQHPFTSSGLVYVSDIDQLIDITNSGENLKAWHGFISKKIERAKSAYEIFMLLNKPYVLTFLKYARQYLSVKDFSEILSEAWIISEDPNMDSNVSKSELTEMFENADREVLMTEMERKLLSGFEETVTVYRGVTNYNAKNIKALSWTTDKAKAEWFAMRFGNSGTVYMAQIERENILAYFIRRNESEVVLN